MAMRNVAEQSPAGPVVAVETDGLLDYLQVLFRVAHAPGASHWCTPGHNRGRVLAVEGAEAPPPLSLLPLRREGAR